LILSLVLEEEIMRDRTRRNDLRLRALEVRSALKLSKAAAVREDERRFLNVVRVSLASLLLFAKLSAGHSQAQNALARNIVLVHGAWVDGSGWKPVYEILKKDGYRVSVVQEPQTSFQADVAATKRVLAEQPSPCILVGHSYGGSVITEAGTNSHVVGLVYIAAHMPDAGESEGADGKRFPSDVSKSGAIETTTDGFNCLKPSDFPEYFAADLTIQQAGFEAQSQMLTAIDNFTAKITTPAWRAKPSSMLANSLISGVESGEISCRN
jgi:pimeloyl-ACP methyl ester carboxylesterase